MRPLLAAAALAANAAEGTPDWQLHWPGYALEFGLLLAGLPVLLQMGFFARKRWTAQLAPAWPGPPSEALVDLAAFLAPLLAVFGFDGFLLPRLIRIAHIDGTTGQLLLSVLLVEGSFLAVIVCFHFLRRRLTLNSTAMRTARWGPAVFLAAWPVVFALILGWQWLLDKCGHPPTDQELVDQFRALSTWSSRGAFILFASVLAPITEEIIFRGILFRGLKRVLPRWAAALVSATLFGAAHSDLSSLVPLIALGFIFALAYDATGCIAVTMVAHGLFNLNTIVALLLGVGS